MVSCLVFKSLSHFEFIFVYDVRECSNFTDFHAAVQLSQHHLLKVTRDPDHFSLSQDITLAHYTLVILH